MCGAKNLLHGSLIATACCVTITNEIPLYVADERQFLGAVLEARAEKTRNQMRSFLPDWQIAVDGIAAFRVVAAKARTNPRSYDLSDNRGGLLYLCLNGNPTVSARALQATLFQRELLSVWLQDLRRYKKREDSLTYNSGY